MNFKHLSLAALAACALFTSCEKEENSENRNDESGSKYELPSSRAFILNQGVMNLNDANISFYAPDGNADFIPDIYQGNNDIKLGDTGQALIADGRDMYVTVTGSGYVAKLNAAAQKTASFTLDNPAGGFFQPRSLAVAGGKLYVSYYGGKLVSCSTSDLGTRETILDLPGTNFEGVAVIGSKVYVCQSYAQTSGGFEYFDKVYAVDTKTKAVEPITVGVNPNDIAAVADKLYLLSWGNYATYGYDFQVIDTAKGNKVTHIAPATKMAAGKENIYLVNSVTDWTTYTTTNTFFRYDIAKGAVVEESFLKNAPAELASAAIYMMSVDPASGDLYIGTTTYTSEGTVYRFDSKGNFVAKFPSGGINPCAMAFFR